MGRVESATATGGLTCWSGFLRMLCSHTYLLMMANMFHLECQLQSIISGFVEEDLGLLLKDGEREDLWSSTGLCQEKVGERLVISCLVSVVLNPGIIPGFLDSWTR